MSSGPSATTCTGRAGPAVEACWHRLQPAPRLCPTLPALGAGVPAGDGQIDYNEFVELMTGKGWHGARGLALGVEAPVEQAVVWMHAGLPPALQHLGSVGCMALG